MRFFEQFRTWQLYMHYLLLAGALFYIHYLTDVWGLESYAVANTWMMPGLFLFYMFGLLVADVVIVALLGFVQPKAEYGGKYRGR